MPSARVAIYEDPRVRLISIWILGLGLGLHISCYFGKGAYGCSGGCQQEKDSRTCSPGF
jgi:hypothetical protein